MGYTDGGVIRIRPDSALVLPAGRHHQIVKSGDAPLRLLAAFPRTPVQTLLPDRVPIDLPWRS